MYFKEYPKPFKTLIQTDGTIKWVGNASIYLWVTLYFKEYPKPFKTLIQTDGTIKWVGNASIYLWVTLVFRLLNELLEGRHSLKTYHMTAL